MLFISNQKGFGQSNIPGQRRSAYRHLYDRFLYIGDGYFSIQKQLGMPPHSVVTRNKSHAVFV